MSLSLIQKELHKLRVKGWLLYDFKGLNPFFKRILQLSDKEHMTRRVFYWIPTEGEPVKVLHKIESHLLSDIRGIVQTYSSFESLREMIKTFQGPVLMEYSETIPYVSFIDGGMIDFLRKEGVQIHTSAPIIQRLLSVLSEKQITSHRRAASDLQEIVYRAYEFIRKRHELYEKEVQDYLVQEMHKQDLMMEHPPIVASGKNSANPHYTIIGKGSKIEKGHLLLIDLWGKKKEEGAIYADLTRMASLGEPSQKVQKAFECVKEASQKAIDLLRSKPQVEGWEVGRIARLILEKGGYKNQILHRIGHNIECDLHGVGAHLDDFETLDTRKILPRTVYAVEPALYFPGEFGVRLEKDIIVHEEGVEITGGDEEKIFRIEY